MADPRFFTNRGPFTLAKLARIAEAELRPEAPMEKKLRDVAPLEVAGPDDVSFLDNRRYVEAFQTSRAGACVVEPALADRAPEGMALLLSRRPYRAYARIARAFYPRELPRPGIHPAAHVDPTAKIGEGCSIAAGAVIGPEVRLGPRVFVGANAVVEANVEIGADTEIGPNATLSHCIVGERVLIHPGVQVGQRGFGFDMDAKGHLDVPQLGLVRIEDEVEVGANSTIDRGASTDTVIGAGSKIDNLVQIGHNVKTGKGCVIVAQAGVSGSTRLEDHVVLAAQSGVAGHLRVGKGAQVGAQGGVMRDVPAGSRIVGSPAVPVRDFFRQVATLARLAKERGKTQGH